MSGSGRGEGRTEFQLMRERAAIIRFVENGPTPHPCPFPYRRGVLTRFALFLLLIFASAALAQPTYPPLTGRIVDGANLLSPDARGRIEQKLKAHEDKTSDQLVVATVPSLQGVTIEDFANGLFRAWKLGQAKTNNGVLLLVAPNERKVRIEVGYGLEGALTDALSNVIITTAITPKFRTGDFSGGIEAGADAILAILAGDAEEWQRRAAIREDTTSPFEIMVVAFIVFVILTMVVLPLLGVGQRRSPLRHRTRDGRWITIPTGSGWGSGGWSGGGGGWSGGSGGGFSGSGGSSGGGGSSGSW